ncbi:MAG: sugar phosphate nucleotidyltransferase [Dehalococcoidales bacterium]
MNNTTAVILAGGKGERMGVLCQARPKPSLPFAGKYRVIDFSLSNCIYSEINNIAVLTDYRRAHLADYIHRWRLMNTKRANLRVLEPKNGSYSGTADAVYQNLGLINKDKTDTVLILAADHVYKLDYREMLAFHHRVNADVTVGVVPVPPAQAARFGTVSVSADNRISDFYEKSLASLSNLASMGIYIFNRKILGERLMEDAARPGSPHDFGYSIIPEAVKKHRVFAYVFAGYWRDIGTIDTYYQTNLELVRARPRFSLDGASPVLTREHLYEPPCIGSQAGIMNSLVSPGCVIRGRVENSVLSPRVWVDEGAVVRDSIIMGNTFIGRDSIVDGCILDEWVKVGVHSYVGLGHIPNAVDENITVLGQGVTIPPDTIVERKRKSIPERSPAGTVMTVVAFSGGLTPGVSTDTSTIKVVS